MRLEEAAKLEALREAARIGASALDRREWKEFESSEDLQTCLNDLSDKVMDATERGHLELRMIDAQDGDNWW